MSINGSLSRPELDERIAIAILQDNLRQLVNRRQGAPVARPKNEIPIAFLNSANNSMDWTKARDALPQK